MSRSEVPEITAADLKARLDAGEAITLVDVREPAEWEIGNLADHGARLRPMDELRDWIGDLDRESEIVVYCRSGNRSAWIARDLIDAGFERVRNLKGGILAWAEEVDPSIPKY